jgi:adenine-specific DNA methylase
MQHTFGRQALPMVWDFAEVVPIADAPGNWRSGYELIGDVVGKWPVGTFAGQVEIADACHSPLISDTANVWFTDPPYYDSVPYADLSDFFLVWLKRVLPAHPLLRDPYELTNRLSPKKQELTVTTAAEEDAKAKDRDFFEEGTAKAFCEGRVVLKEDGIG